MVKSSVRKSSSSKKNKFGTSFWIKFCFVTLLIFAFIFAVFHYKNALLYYFSFKTDKIVKQDKLTAARIHQLLKKHDDKIAGFDVSEYQSEINWEEVDSIQNFKLHFVFIRATAGADKTDSKFKENWKNAKEFNFIRGAYHYYRPNENSLEQAKNFVRVVKLSKGDLPPVLDIEKLPETQSIDSLKVGLKRWLEFVDKKYHIKPIIYSGESYYEDFLKEEFSEYPLWIANYNPWREKMEDDWHFWQFTEKGVIKGINTTVDVNIYNGTPKMLAYLTKSH
jgi:lysozyme